MGRFQPRPHQERPAARGHHPDQRLLRNSTRTLLSFEIAGKKLGADVVNMHAAQSSVKKGETLIDTAVTLNAMRGDVIVIRHSSSGAVHLIADKVDCPVLNAGDGWHEHPTQGLLDALTIRRRRGGIAGQRVVICGDILHSRVARSNMLALTALAAEVRVCAPRDADAHGRRGDGRHALHRLRRRARGRRRGDDAAPPERADVGRLHPLHARISPALRPHARTAGARQARRAGDAPGADEPRRRDRFERRRTIRFARRHRAGGDGRGGAHGLPRRAHAAPRGGVEGWA